MNMGVSNGPVMRRLIQADGRSVNARLKNRIIFSDSRICPLRDFILGLQRVVNLFPVGRYASNEVIGL
jgi:hypothetical protein